MVIRCIRTLSTIQYSRPICMGFTTARLVNMLLLAKRKNPDIFWCLCRWRSSIFRGVFSRYCSVMLCIHYFIKSTRAGIPGYWACCMAFCWHLVSVMHSLTMYPTLISVFKARNNFYPTRLKSNIVVKCGAVRVNAYLTDSRNCKIRRED